MTGLAPKIVVAVDPGASRFSNRYGVGAKVRVLAHMRGADIWQLREIYGGDGYGYSQPLEAHFGLGDATSIDVLRIEWPSGAVQELRNVAVNQIIEITEPPLLSIEPAIILSWPLLVEEYVLEGADDVEGPWIEIDAPVQEMEGQFIVTVRARERVHFYRLSMP